MRANICAINISSGDDDVWAAQETAYDKKRKKKHLKSAFFSPPPMLGAVNQRPREERCDCQSVMEKAASSPLLFPQKKHKQLSAISSLPKRRAPRQEKQQRSLGEHFVPLPLSSFPDADFHFNCVKALFLTSEKCVRVRVLIRECKNTACRIFMLITL